MAGSVEKIFHSCQEIDNTLRKLMLPVSIFNYCQNCFAKIQEEKMIKSISIILALFIGLGVCNAFGKVKYLPMEHHQSADGETKSILSAFGKLPLHFVANHGQLDESVVYYAKSEGATVYCTEQGLVFGFAEGSIRLKFSDGKRVQPEARSELERKVNYFIGNDPALWRTNIPTFSEVVYQNVYTGLDLVYSGNQRRLKYTFYLKPGADVNQIQMIYDGVEDVSLDDDTGELVIQTQWGEMRDSKPVGYQNINGVKKAIDISFRLIGQTSVGFAIGDYDPKFMLVVDPGYSTYLGGGNDERANDIAVDSSGNAYVTGSTQSSDFPTQNAYQGSNAGGLDDFVTKLNSSGQLTASTYSTYLGGGNDDAGSGIAVDSFDNAYVTGYTLSSDFPTENPYQGSNAGGRDVFVTKLLSNGSPTLVELSLLTAIASADGVILRWRTEAEIDNVGFTVYRSSGKDGNYTRLAFIPGAEDSETSNDYQFTDKEVEPGKTYFYYLEDIDLAGEKSKSEIIKVILPPAQPALAVPTEFRLLQNYPNPFNPDTWLPYELAKDATVTIRIYNVKRQLVRQLDLGVQKTGSYLDKQKAAYWDGKDRVGKVVTSGLYFYTLKAGDFTATRRMIVVK